MKNFRIVLLLLISSISFQSIAQSDEEVQPTNMDKLLEVVREGRSRAVSYTHLTLPTKA